MGGDGGQVIDRATMVRTKGYGLTKSGSRYTNSLGEMANYVQMVSEDRGLGYLEKRAVRLQSCFLSQQGLQEPIVACRLGNLYNKEAIIGALLNKTMPKSLNHIRALKDVKPCVIKWSVSGEGEGSADSNETQGRRETLRRRIVCPMTSEDCDTGGSRSVLIWPTGVIMCQKALKELKLKECPVTCRPFDPDQDLITLCPDEEELQKMEKRLPQKKRKAEDAGKDAKDTSKPTEASEATAAAEKKAKLAIANPHGERTVGNRTGLYKSMFTRESSQIGDANRDGFGAPCFNAGSRI